MSESSSSAVSTSAQSFRPDEPRPHPSEDPPPKKAKDSKSSKEKPTICPPFEELYKPKRAKNQEVWAVFGLHKKYDEWAFCTGCQNWFAYASSPTPLAQHMKICPKATLILEKLISSQAKKKPKPPTAFFQRHTLSQDDKLVALFTMCGLPFNVVDKPEFRAFVAGLNPNYKLPGRTAASALVDKAYDAKRESLLQELKNAESVCVTTDSATTVSQDSLQAVTCHWITRSWAMRSAVLEVAGTRPLFGMT